MILIYYMVLKYYVDTKKHSLRLDLKFLLKLDLFEIPKKR